MCVDLHLMCQVWAVVPQSAACGLFKEVGLRTFTCCLNVQSGLYCGLEVLVCVCESISFRCLAVFSVWFEDCMSQDVCVVWSVFLYLSMSLDMCPQRGLSASLPSCSSLL